MKTNSRNLRNQDNYFVYFLSILKILVAILYVLYIFSIVFLFATQSISEKGNDFSRWFSSVPLRKVSISTDNGLITLYEVNKLEFDYLIRRFQCQKQDIDSYDKAIISSYPNLSNIESVFKSVSNLDLEDDDNMALAYNVTVYAYELSDGRILVHYNDSEHQDMTHCLSIKPLKNLSRFEKNVLYFQDIICLFIFILLFFLPALLLIINNNITIKSSLVSFLLCFLPLLIYWAYKGPFYHSDVAVFLLFFITNIFVLFMQKLIKLSIKRDMPM